MDQKQISDEKLYKAIKKIQLEINKINEKLDKQRLNIELEDLKFLGDENLLAESWFSKEDEDAFAYLQ